MLNEHGLIIPDWPAPANVRAIQTSRAGGVSKAPYRSLNLGMHVGDNPLDVANNRQLLNRYVPTEPVWLNQVHGIHVVDAATASCVPDADATFANSRNTVCAVMTADCLPVLLCDKAGTMVAAVHAGWRSLLDGVIEETVAAMITPGAELLAWLGPAIGPQAFEVGDEVRLAFIAKDAAAVDAFRPRLEGKWLADIFRLGRQRLANVGVTSVYGGGLCTYSEPERFFSFRRDQATGRMASLIWLE
ncbi:peptidoglycan editing factor PgeF [Methylobacillus gramineus]|uniref:peptidoglycan editing factor PgeF n=1 Tax=Methylobacillus gramineus TaxID=755169 RepID=UPI001CFFA732|nr:peptidoglycan editing factor PgeF [Methylobacillus gramineus]MCB5184157.1 peptidoglycan editing factor PgeF [Methylobacillus gramineus]